MDIVINKFNKTYPLIDTNETQLRYFMLVMWFQKSENLKNQSGYVILYKCTSFYSIFLLYVPWLTITALLYV